MKIIKKIFIIIAIIAVTILGIAIVVVAYNCINEYHIKPLQEKSLYEQGLKDINKADEVALKFMFNCEFYDAENKAIDILTNAARKGKVSSAVLLGRYYKGYDIRTGFDGSWQCKGKEDLEKCSYWYLQAAQKGNAEAQGELGHNYKYGIGVKQDFNKAIYWLKLGAKGGDPVAEWRLGYLYLNGLALYNIDFLHTNYWYNGDGEFISLDNEKYQVKRSYLKDILDNPQKVYFKPNINKAKYYWGLAASQGLQEAKEALEKVYD